MSQPSTVFWWVGPHFQTTSSTSQSNIHVLARQLAAVIPSVMELLCFTSEKETTINIKPKHKVVPQFGIAKLVQISPISLGLMNGGYIYSIHGDYKPTFTSLWGHHMQVCSTIKNQEATILSWRVRKKKSS